MALLTTGLVDNPSVAGIRPSAALDVLLINDTLLPAAVRITGYYVSGGIKTPYVLELLALAPDAVSIRNYFSQFDIFEFQFEITGTGVEISVWGKDAAGNINTEHRLVPKELNLPV
ncbi:MAG TPA: hypothetical protein VN370_09770 [Desulfitobacteriaceae bacterium]|jgi:hypothetical protein|nr:hypothetical protein [Desulfitobacteriaceae bacterium]